MQRIIDKLTDNNGKRTVSQKLPYTQVFHCKLLPLCGLNEETNLSLLTTSACSLYDTQFVYSILSTAISTVHRVCNILNPMWMSGPCGFDSRGCKQSPA